MADSQHLTTDADKAGTRKAPPPAAVEADKPRAKVYLDRSRDFSTIHGDIAPGDPHHGIASYQDGLPFNHEDELLFEHPEVQSNPDKLKKAERLVTRAAKLLERARSAEPSDDEDDDDTQMTEGPVNINAWARVIADYPWQEITNFIARKYSKRVKDKHDALELLLNEKAVSLAQLSAKHRAIIDRGYA